MSDAVTTWIDQFEPFKWLNLSRSAIMKQKEQTAEVGTGKHPMDDRSLAKHALPSGFPLDPKHEAAARHWWWR